MILKLYEFIEFIFIYIVRCVRLGRLFVISRWWKNGEGM